jgi:hypothetical protein
MRRSASIQLGFLAPLVFFAAPAFGNDRLPKRLREGYDVARAEVRKYMRYVLPKVFGERIRALVAEKLPRPVLDERAGEVVDEIVHLLLPYAKKVTGDVLFGTDSTHVRITMPERRAAALRAAALALPGRATPAQSVRDAIEQLGSVAERALHDRIEQALLEDMEDYVQLWVEGATGLPLRGRPRHWMRPLPREWKEPYERQSRAQVHRFLYYWLRKRQRLALSHLATSMTRDEIDRARHEGPVWRLLSGASHEAWAQNWLRMDFKWGRVNWEIDRRRIRRRMDQDLALGTWALARLAKEVTSTETVRQASAYLDRRLREELSKPPLKERAERFPHGARELEQEMQRLLPELDPIFNRAMDRVPLEREMPPDIREIAREHGRRYGREELGGALTQKVRLHASGVAAARRVRDRLPGWVSEALGRFDPGEGGRGDLRRRARDFVRKETLRKVRGEVSEALREAGFDELVWSEKRRARAIDEVVQGQGLEQEIDRAFDERMEDRR